MSAKIQTGRQKKAVEGHMTAEPSNLWSLHDPGIAQIDYWNYANENTMIECR